MLVDSSTIEKQQSFVLKWAETPFNSETEGVESRYAFNPGWTQPTQVDTFYRRMEEKSSILKDSTRITMESLQQEIDYLRTELNFDDLRYVQTLDDDADIGKPIQDVYKFRESIPHFNRKELIITNCVARSLLPESFLKENIEKESFLASYEGDLASAAAPTIERIGMYGILDPARPHGRSAMDSKNGVFQQLAEINRKSTTGSDEPQGFGSPFITKQGNIVEQFMDKIDEFIAQNGKDDYAQFYISRPLYNKVLKEVSRRETDGGDGVLFNGREVTIFGIPLKRVSFLNPRASVEKRNGWGHLALLCDPASLCWGFFNELESKSSYIHEKLSYLNTLQVGFDVIPIWEQDLLAFNIDDFGSGTLTLKVLNAAGEGINGATVEIFDPTSATPDTALFSGTTAAAQVLDIDGNPMLDTDNNPITENGVCEIADIPYGKYTVKVSATGLKTQEFESTIINNDKETMYVSMKK